MNQAEQTLNEVRTGKKSVRKMPTISEIMQSEDVDNFLGIGKKAKTKKTVRVEKRAVRVEQRQDKRAAKTENRRAKGQNMLSKAKSRVILAEQGIVQTNTGGEILSGAKSLISGLTGGVKPSREQDEDNTPVFRNPKPLPVVEDTPQSTQPKQPQSTRPKVEAGIGTNIEERSEKTENVTAAEKETAEPKKDNKMLLIAGAAVAIFLMMKK